MINLNLVIIKNLFTLGAPVADRKIKTGDYVWVWDTNPVHGKGWRAGLVTKMSDANPYKWTGDLRTWLPDDVMYVEFLHEDNCTSAGWFGLNGWDAGMECPDDFPGDYVFFTPAITSC